MVKDEDETKKGNDHQNTDDQKDRTDDQATADDRLSRLEQDIAAKTRGGSQRTRATVPGAVSSSSSGEAPSGPRTTGGGAPQSLDSLSRLEQRHR